ncbi:MAG: tetratricopeptide repeat protein [Bacteroidales bacterium]|nr:tetratricopeptide repeat protein [Bacteroidales bacterium]
MKRIFVPLLLIILTSSCAMQELYLNVTQPAPVTIAPEIKTVGVIDRSMPTDETEVVDLLEKVLTLEGEDLDIIGSGEAIKGMKEELTANDRFSEVRLLTDTKFKTSYTGNLPAPLMWEQIDLICRENGTDALFSMEMYDTDTRINYSTENVRVPTPMGDIPMLEHIVSMETLVKTGWRIYSPVDRLILDEYIMTESITSTGRGVNPAKAISALLLRKDAVRQVSNKAGHVYAMRLLPYVIRVTRDYYVKGTDSFKVAQRMAQLGNWNDAAELWEKETTSNDSKVAGRAHYNMAIINEINGDLEAAISWAQKSYEYYKIKPGLDYSRILQNRLNNLELLRYQEER